MRPKSRMFVFFFLILVIFAGLNYFIGWNAYLFLTYYWPAMSAPAFGIIFSIIAFSYLIGRIKVLGPAGRLLKVMGAYYVAVLEFSVILLPFADLAAWLMRTAGYDRSEYIPVIGFTVLVLLSVIMVRGSWNAWSPIVRTYPVTIAKQAGSVKQLRIAVASDIHLGNVVGNRHLKRLVSIVEGLKPDLILLPGDVIDDVIEPFIRNQMSRNLGRLQAQYGIYAVLGNHEYYGGHIEEYVKQMDQIGIRVLQDEKVSIGDFMYVAGRKDKTAESAGPGGRLSVDTLLSGMDKSKPIILMDHQPYQFDKAAAAGADILLSGHTHRGQFAPNHWITRRIFELDWGYLLKDKLHVIVSSGFGSWGPPIRLASRSEIIEIVVTFEA